MPRVNVILPFICLSLEQFSYILVSIANRFVRPGPAARFGDYWGCAGIGVIPNIIGARSSYFGCQCVQCT